MQKQTPFTKIIKFNTNTRLIENFKSVNSSDLFCVGTAFQSKDIFHHFMLFISSSMFFLCQENIFFFSPGKNWIFFQTFSVIIFTYFFRR